LVSIQEKFKEYRERIESRLTEMSDRQESLESVVTDGEKNELLGAETAREKSKTHTCRCHRNHPGRLLQLVHETEGVTGTI
jgi:uncharacterized HAD superfamily protein